MDYDESGLPNTALCLDSAGMKRPIRQNSNDWVSRQLQGEAPGAPGAPGERRSRADRRQRVFWSAVYGSFNPRRRRPPRRLDDSRYHAMDWHSAHLLAVSLGILILSVADAFMTLRLISEGAVEVNPLMALFVAHGEIAMFAALKMAMTGISVMLMVFLARHRFMRMVRVEVILYGILVAYMILIGHELGMLQRVADLNIF